MNMRNLLLLFASLALCSGGVGLQAQTAQPPQTPQARPASPASPASPPATALAPEAQQDAAPALAVLMEEGNFLGIIPGDVKRENMGRYGLSEPRGVLVTKVLENSPAARAGLKEGDVILRFNNEAVTSVRQLNRLISEAAPEQTVRLGVSRQGSQQELNATLARRKDFPSLQGSLPPAEMLRALPQGDALRALREGFPKGDNLTFALGTTRRIGVGTAQLTKQLADYFGVTGGRGVLVTSVNENSPAAKAGLRAGDVITEVDGQQTGTVGELMRALNRQKEGEVNISITRDKHQRTIKVTPERGQMIPFDGQDELIMPQIGELAIPQIDMSRMALPVLPGINFAIPRMTFPNIQKFKLAPMSLPDIKLLTPKHAPM